MKTLGSFLVSVVILLGAGSRPALAQIYKWVDDDGRTHYADKAPAGRRKFGTVTDRISVYAPDPSVVARAAADAGADPALSERVDSLERQLQAERLARQQIELAAFTQESQPVYVPYAVSVVVPFHHRRHDIVRPPFPGPKVVGPGIMPGTFNGPNAVTAGNFTLRTSLPVSGGRGGARFASSN